MLGRKRLSDFELTRLQETGYLPIDVTTNLQAILDGLSMLGIDPKDVEVKYGGALKVALKVD